MVNLEDLIESNNNAGANKPSIIEALLSTVDAIFTNNRMLQRTRISPQHIRGISRLIGMQSFLRARFNRAYKPFLDAETGEFTYDKYDNRVLTAVADGVIAGRISLNGKSRDEIIRIFQAVGSAGKEEEQAQSGGILRRFDY